jgi:hypothetical protein
MYTGRRFVIYLKNSFFKFLLFQVLIAATLLAACDCMQQASTGFQNPQGTYSYQKPFTAFNQQPHQLAYQQPAPYQYPQPAYQQVSFVSIVFY